MNNQNQPLSGNESFSTIETESCNCSNDNSSKVVNSQALYEVQAAIAFGYGLFNLVVSLTPPKVLQLAQLLGFHGNQGLGLVCLKYVCQSRNVKAELSR